MEGSILDGLGSRREPSSFLGALVCPNSYSRGLRLLKYDRLSHKAILGYMGQRENRGLLVKLCCKNFIAGFELLQGEAEWLRMEAAKQKKKDSKVAAQSEEEIRARKKLEKRQVVEEAPSRPSELSVKADSERMASDSFDEATVGAPEQASTETPREEEEPTSQPTPRRRVKSFAKKGKRLSKPVYVDTPTPSSSDEARQSPPRPFLLSVSGRGREVR